MTVFSLDFAKYVAIGLLDHILFQIVKIFSSFCKQHYYTVFAQALFGQAVMTIMKVYNVDVP